MNLTVKSFGIITFIAIVSKLLGFGRDTLIAAFFGTSATSDAYFIASIIPTILFASVGMTITTGLVPIYANIKTKSNKEASQIIRVLGTLFFIMSILVTIIFYIYTPFVTRIMAPGFQQEQLELTNSLTRIMLPSFCFYVLSAVMTSILEYERNFVPPALVTIPQNLFIIIAIVFLSQTYGIYAIAITTLIGAFFQVIIQYPSIKKYNIIKFDLHFKKNRKVIKDTLFLLAPMIIASVAFQFNAVIDRMVASQLPSGSVSALNYASKLMYLPLSIILLPLITVLYPSVVDAAVEKGNSLCKMLFKGINMLTFISIPLLIVMFVESRELVDFAYRRGVFDETASNMTTNAFFFYSLGMLFLALKEWLNRFFVAIKETRITMYTSIISIILNIILSITLSSFLDVGGIALATSIALFTQTFVLLFFLPKKVVIEKKIFLAFCLNHIKLFLTFLSTLVLTKALSILYQHQYVIVQLLLTTFFTLLLFIGFSYLYKVTELREATNRFYNFK